MITTAIIYDIIILLIITEFNGIIHGYIKSPIIFKNSLLLSQTLDDILSSSNAFNNKPSSSHINKSSPYNHHHQKYKKPDVNSNKVIELMPLLRNSYNKKDINEFSSYLKQIAVYTHEYNDLSSTLYPMLSEMIKCKLLATNIVDWIWSLPKIGFNIRNYQHKQFIEVLLRKLVFEYDELSSRQVTTSLSGISKLNFKWNNIASGFIDCIYIYMTIFICN